MSLSGVGLAAGQSVTFTLDSASGTATEGIDFSALLAGGLTAAAGIVLTTSAGAGGAINVTATNTTAADLATNAALLSFTIATTPDAVVEGTETFTVTLASATATVVNPPTITTNITDDDLRAITLSGPGSVAEGAATGPYTVSLSGVGLGAGQSVTFTLDSASGTATEGTDFSALLAGGLTAAAGIVLTTSTGAGGAINVTATNTTAADLATNAALLSFTIATTPDAVVEGTENFTVTLASATATVVNPPTITTNITDDDLRAITLSGPGSVAEGAATGPYTVSLSGVGLGAGQSVTFTLDSASGTATEGIDFSALLAGGLTAAAGIVLTTSTGAGGVINVTATNTTAADLATNAALLSFTIATTPDAVVEGTETFTVTLASATATVVNPTITTSITDDDLQGIRLDGPGLVAEGAATGPYTVSLSGVGLGAGQSVTFTLDSASGTATEGTDFSALLAGGLTAAAGIVLTTSTGAGGVINVTATNTTAADLATNAALLSFTIATTPDAVVEGPENFTVTLASAAAVVNPTITTSITDDDLRAIRLDGPGSVAEGAATGPYTVSLSGVGLGAGQSVTFTLDSASGTATEGIDFSALLAAGLTAAAGIVLTTSTGAGGVINVTATNTTAADLATNAALLSFTIATTPDAVVEGTENFTVTLASATATVVNPTITTSITDDDLRAIRLSGPGSVAEGAATGPYTVSLSGVGLGAGQSVTFTLDSASGTATEGTDFSALLAGGLTAAAGIVLTTSTGAGGVINVTATNTTAADLATNAALLSFTIATTPDAVVEGTENFTVTLASATAAVVNPTITTSITDDDLRAITLDGPGSVAEGAATGPYTVSLSGVGLGAGQSVTFTLDSASGTATEGTDFSALLAGGLTAAAGIVLTTSTGAGGVINVTATNTTAADLATNAALLSFTIATTPDAVVEGTENFTVTLASATATVVNPTITTNITDDDLRAITLNGPGSVAEGAATGPYTVSLSGVGLGAGQSVTFTLDSASGTATEGTDFSALTVAGLTAAAGIVLSNFTTDPNGTIHVTATNTTAADLATNAALLSFTIATTPDAVVEGPENFTVTLASATAAVVNPTITTSITDDDLRAITLSGPGSVAEGAATGPYTVSLSGVGLGAGQSVTFTLDSASGTATEGTDFSALLAAGLTAAAGIVLTTSTGAGGVINVTATNTTAADLATNAALLSFTIATTPDAVVEGTENFTVTLASATATVVNPTITTSITDDDLQGIRLDGPGLVAEGAATGPYTVSLSGVGLGAGQSVTFTLDSASGTATEGIDFSALLAGGLTAAAGIVLTTSTGAGGVINVTATNTTAADLATNAALLSFTIATTPDAVVEGTENFTVTLASAAAVVNPTITTSITDDDLRAITLDGPGSVAEGAATGPYTVSLSGVGLGAGQSVTFTLDSASGTATEGTDFSALTVAGLTAAAGIVLSNFTTDPNGTIHVTATNTTAADLATGAALLSFTIATTPDAVVEGPENFTVTLASATATVVNPNDHDEHYGRHLGDPAGWSGVGCGRRPDQQLHGEPGQWCWAWCRPEHNVHA